MYAFFPPRYSGLYFCQEDWNLNLACFQYEAACKRSHRARLRRDVCLRKYAGVNIWMRLTTEHLIFIDFKCHGRSLKVTFERQILSRHEFHLQLRKVGERFLRGVPNEMNKHCFNLVLFLFMSASAAHDLSTLSHFPICDDNKLAVVKHIVCPAQGE